MSVDAIQYHVKLKEKQQMVRGNGEEDIVWSVLCNVGTPERRGSEVYVRPCPPTT